ncbi:MAG: hypothetical protein Q8Q12_09315 [bacterium]|nr:hypothetical protein [bacterium]
MAGEWGRLVAEGIKASETVSHGGCFFSGRRTAPRVVIIFGPRFQITNLITADTTEWEREIDQLVYELYGLTEDEIAIVEDKAP